MKAVKLFTILFSAAVLCLALAVLPKRLAFNGADGYTFYVGDTSKDCRVVTAENNPEFTRLTLSGVCGEAATYKEFDLDAFLLSVGGEIKFTEELSDSVNYYCSANLPYEINLYGEEINLHVCVKADGVTVASPIIFGGY